jgi:probable rRNA maturation factor
VRLLISNEQQEVAVGESLYSLFEDAVKQVLALEEVDGHPSGGRAPVCDAGTEEGAGGADANQNLISRLSSLASQIEVSLVLVDDARMADLNRQYRGLDGTTDVLSFPMLDDLDDLLETECEEVPVQAGAEAADTCFSGSDGEGIGEADANLNPTSDLPPLASAPEVLLGDIVISMPKARDQATTYGNSLTQELVFLAVHGMLHLLGYDDETDHDAERMMARSRQVMDKLGLGAGRDA